MRILRRLSILPALLALAACDGGTLPGTDPIHGEWSASIAMFQPNLDVDRGEHRYAFRPDGTYRSTTIGYQRVGSGWRVVYRGEMTGAYRLEPGGVATSAQAYRWRSAGMSDWREELVADDGVFGPPTPYTVDGDRLIMHHGPSQGEHGQPIPAQDKVYTRRR